MAPWTDLTSRERKYRAEFATRKHWAEIDSSHETKSTMRWTSTWSTGLSR